MLKDAALHYIQSGFSIIPIIPKGKTPPIKWKRFQKKKPTEQEITRWWSKWPDANIALLTGTINNLVAFDEDGPEAEKLIKEKGGFPPGPQSITKKGRHYLFKHPGFLVHQDVNKKLTLDVRGDGGYIVAPPSIHPSGAQYSWAPGLSLFEIEIPEMRPFQIDYLKEHCGDETGPRNVKDWYEEAIQGVEKGSRNDMAAKLAGRYIKKGLSDDEVILMLISWNKKNRPPLPQNELYTAVKSIRETDARNKKKSESINPTKSFLSFKKEKKPQFNVQFMVEYIEKQLRPVVYDLNEKEFYLYDPCGMWKIIPELEIKQMAQKQLGKYANPRWTQQTTENLKSWIYRPQDQLEYDPMRLNLQNGMLNLHTMELIPHSPEFNSRAQLAVVYQEDAKCTLWLDTLAEIFADDLEKAEVIQEFFGYCLYPKIISPAALFQIGGGNNGKYVIEFTLCELLGKKNVSHISLARMMKDFGCIEIKDKLLNSSGETETSRLDVTNFKKIATGDEIQAEVKYKGDVKFTPIAKHLISMNNLPAVKEKTDAFFRRIIIVEYKQTFEGENLDLYRKEKLLKELNGIFKWSLEGLKKVLKRGFIYSPESAIQAKKRYRERINPVLLFVDEACNLTPGSRELPHILYNTYDHWCTAAKIQALGKQNFYEQIRLNYPEIVKKRYGSKEYFIGVSVSTVQDNGDT